MIPDLTFKKATKVMWHPHTKGKAVAKTYHKELAELYEERLRERPDCQHGSQLVQKSPPWLLDGYYLEVEADTLLLCGPDGTAASYFGTPRASKEANEQAAEEDRHKSEQEKEAGRGLSLESRGSNPHCCAVDT